LRDWLALFTLLGGHESDEARDLLGAGAAG
jgi:hypothetical protein